MTKDEFWNEYKKLAHKFPDEYPLQDTMKLRIFFDLVKDLDCRWMARNVARILLQNYRKFDWRAAASGELRSRREAEKTAKLILESESISDNGLEAVLLPLGIKSLVDCLTLKRIEDESLDSSNSTI